MLSHQPIQYIAPQDSSKARDMCNPAFLKALDHQSLSNSERATLADDELFVLVLSQRLDDLTQAERGRLAPGDLGYLVAHGVISPKCDSQTLRAEALSSL